MNTDKLKQAVEDYMEYIKTPDSNSHVASMYEHNIFERAIEAFNDDNIWDEIDRYTSHW